MAIDVAEQIADVLQGRPARTAVNLPAMSGDEMEMVAPYLKLGTKIGSLHMQLAREAAHEGRPINAVEVVFNGDFGGMPSGPVTRAVLRGLMTPVADEAVNLVNAPYLTEMRGIKVVEAHRDAVADHTCLLSVRAHLPGSDRTICGTVYDGEPHIVHIDGYHVDILPEGAMVITQHTDRPGIIGKIGTLFGDNHINIAGMHVGREASGGRAIMVLMVDDPVGSELIAQIKELPGMEQAQLVTL